MKLATWNINSVRLRQDLVLRFLKEQSPDVLCLQETKVMNALFPGQALAVAGTTGRLTTVDFHFDLTQAYTFWSGLVGGTFLALGYFGCDQSQVQRYLTAKSIDAAPRHVHM